MHFAFLLVLFLVSRTEQHLSYPVNYCNMATTCIHDNRVVCASSVDGCSRRTFLDQCDMYEFNCDYNTRYQETYRLFCTSSDLEAVSETPVTTAITTDLQEDMTFIEENVLEELKATIPTTCVCVTSTTIPTTSPITTITSTTPFTTTSASTTTSTTPAPTTIRTTSSPSTTTTTSPSTTTRTTTSSTTPSTNKPSLASISSSLMTTTRSTTEMTITEGTVASTSHIPSIFKQPTGFTGCCDRPKSWETTIEEMKTIFFYPIEDPTETTTATVTTLSSTPSTIKSTTKAVPLVMHFTPSSTYKTTTNSVPLIVSTRSSLPSTISSTTKLSTVVHKTTELKNITSTILQPTSTLPTETTTNIPSQITKKTTACGTCHRPKTWETTTEDIKTIFIYPIKDTTKPILPIVTTPSSTSIKSTTTSLRPPSTTPSSTTKTTIKPVPLVVSTRSSLPSTTITPTTLETKSTEHTTDISTILQNFSIAPTETKATTSCLTCHRPKTWQTTTENELPYIFFITKPTSINSDVPIEINTAHVQKTPQETPEITTAQVKTTAHVTTMAPITTTASITTTTRVTTTSKKYNEPTTQLETTTHVKPTAPKNPLIKTTTSQDIISSDSDEFLEQPPDNDDDSPNQSSPKVATTTKESDSDEEDKIKLGKKYIKTTNWWYPTMCKSNNCARPVTWLTTKKRRNLGHRKF